MKRIPPKEKIDQIQTKRQNTRTEEVEVVELSTNAIKFDHRLAAEEAWKQGNKQKAAYHRHMLAEEAWKQENYSEVPKEFLNGLICRPAFPSCISFLSISDKSWVETWYMTYCKEVQRIFVLWGNKAYLEKLAEKEAHRSASPSLLEKIAIREFDKGEVNKAFAIAYACEEFQKEFQMTPGNHVVSFIQGRFLSSFYGEDIAENSLSFEYLVLLYAALENQYKQHNILNTIKNEAVKNLKLFAYPLELIQDPSYIKVDIEEMIIKYAITLKKLLLAYVKIDPLCTIIEDYIVAGELTQDRVFVKAEDFIKPGEFEQDDYVSLPLHGENADGGCCIL